VSDRRLYQLTSIGRPLDPAWPTNRAVIRLLPVAAAVGAAAYGLRDGLDAGLLWAAASAALAAFGAWALARELGPDPARAAFAAMALALGTLLALDGAPLLPLFVALFLVRIVNRSVGLPARIGDSVLVAALAVAAAWAFGNPWYAFIGGIAFLLDATQPPELPRQRWFAAACAVVGVLIFKAHAPGDTVALAGWSRWLPLVIGGGFMIVILATRRVESVGDATGETLSLTRVRAGMWIGLFVAAQSLLAGPAAVREVALVWATLAGMLAQRPRWR
jgi:hypothetical protein